MPEHSVELRICLVAPKRWKHTTVQLVERILKDKAKEAIQVAEGMAEGWTKHGEPVEVKVDFVVSEK